jgi:hypothetical protein
LTTVYILNHQVSVVNNRCLGGLDAIECSA